MIQFCALFAIALLMSSPDSFAGEKPRIITEDSPHVFYQDLPQLKRIPFTKRKIQKSVQVPSLGTKMINLDYFEFLARPDAIIPGAERIALTLVRARERRDIHVAVMTAKDPDGVTLVNEGVNSHLPGWLIERGIDMHNVYRRPMGGYTFKWDGKAWSFDQLSEVLSTVVSAQGMPGGYMNKGAALRVCDEETNPSVNNHPIYGLTLHLLKKHGCNLNTLHEESGKALQAFMDTAPRF